MRKERAEYSGAESSVNPKPPLRQQGSTESQIDVGRRVEPRAIATCLSRRAIPTTPSRVVSKPDVRPKSRRFGPRRAERQRSPPHNPDGLNDHSSPGKTCEFPEVRSDNDKNGSSGIVVALSTASRNTRPQPPPLLSAVTLFEQGQGVIAMLVLSRKTGERI